MTRILAAVFLGAHGLIHLSYLSPKPPDDPHYPFIPEGRWFPRAVGLRPGPARTLAVAMAVSTAVAFGVAAIALLARADLWTIATVVASAISLVLMLLFFHPWLSIGIAIDLALIADVLWFEVPSSLFQG